ncbi:hypothetical protein [Micromonospora sp. b486]|uniref:hypothetical protein n=1 Tax=Micromonospora sp. b486 TaxID=3053986 RepID=UPI00259D1F08|nr:hypothetical protein [Micromonospora sp. b486]MDM4778011.1 hypothetical protein [Micromonospora sp. b486]
MARAFALSYEQVSPVAQRVFRLLGMHPVAQADSLVPAVLAELPLPEAQDALRRTVDVHLVEEAEPGRYRQHDLSGSTRACSARTRDRRGAAGGDGPAALTFTCTSAATLVTSLGPIALRRTGAGATRPEATTVA